MKVYPDKNNRINSKIKRGEICAICHCKLALMTYDRPIACEDCGGEALLKGGDLNHE